MKILYAGSPAIAVPAFKALLESGLEIAGVLTNPDAPQGRKHERRCTELAAAAFPYIPVIKPEKIDKNVVSEISALKPDILVSFAYGHIFPLSFLEAFPLGGVNVHPSLLPRFRGPSPLQAAILAGDSVTGVTLQRLAAKMDEGNILAQERLAIDERETAMTLGEKAASLAAKMLPALMLRVREDGFVPEGEAQAAEGVSYCRLVRRENTLIDWAASAAAIDRQIRAYAPEPCYTLYRGEELYILEGNALPCADFGDRNAQPGEVTGKDKEHGILVSTGDGVFAARRLQMRARKALGWKDFLNGARDFLGAALGS